MATTKTISVRLTDEARAKINLINAQGTKTSAYINHLIVNASTADVSVAREMLVHINRIESEMEFEEDAEVKNLVRKELHSICRLLKSSLNRT